MANDGLKHCAYIHSPSFAVSFFGCNFSIDTLKGIPYPNFTIRDCVFFYLHICLFFFFILINSDFATQNNAVF